jgi:acyl-CoA synthetase (AMP-forming)/AMP-acid ligase II
VNNSCVASAKDLTTLWDLLTHRSQADRCCYIIHDPRTGHDRRLTLARLAEASAQASAGLQALRDSRGRAGDRTRVLVATPDPLRFIIAFFATIGAGLVPVPAPSHPLVHPRHLRRLRTLVTSADALAVITDNDRVSPLAGQLPQTTPVVGLDDLKAAGATGSTPAPLHAVAYVQYTSGSQADPKPVALGHHNVLAQLSQAAHAYGEDETCVGVSWTPLYHDMGLVTAVLRPLYSGYPSVLIDPFDFVRDPALWLRLMSRWRATHTSAPDFGYSLCARKAGADGLDLSRLKVARSAGEPVRARTLCEFTQRFRSAGFDHAAFKASYGLAEATLTVTTTPLTRPPTTLRLSTSALRRGQVRPSSDPYATEVVSCGPPLPHTEIAVLDPDTGQRLSPSRLGEVWIAGPQVVPFDDTAWVVDDLVGHRTGDIGFIHDRELYLLGRGSERFQVAGENFYSAELEALVAAVDRLLRPGRVAVFPAQLPHWPEPAVVVLAECRDGADHDSATLQRLARAIVAAVGHHTRLAVSCVWLVQQGSLAVTTSGKLKRERCRDAFEDGTIDTLHRYERVPR